MVDISTRFAKMAMSGGKTGSGGPDKRRTAGAKSPLTTRKETTNMLDPTLVFTAAGLALLGIGAVFGSWFSSIHRERQIRDAYLEGRRDTEAAFDVLLKMDPHGLIDTEAAFDNLLGKEERP
jgi:hypothetical protein